MKQSREVLNRDEVTAFALHCFVLENVGEWVRERNEKIVNVLHTNTGIKLNRMVMKKLLNRDPIQSVHFKPTLDNLHSLGLI